MGNYGELWRNLEYDLPDPDVPLVYSPECSQALNYAQERHESWEDEMSAATASPVKKQVLGKSNLHTEEDFRQKLEGLDLDPRLKKLLT